MGGRNPRVCQLCREAVRDTVCLDCAAKGIKGWLPGALSERFERFQRVLLFYVDAFGDGALPCGECGQTTGVCRPCYASHVREWLEREDRTLAREFGKALEGDVDKAWKGL